MLYLVGKTDINRCFPHSTKEKCFDVIHFKNVVLKDYIVLYKIHN